MKDQGYELPIFSIEQSGYKIMKGEFNLCIIFSFRFKVSLFIDKVDR
jgi:hypothetical protein